MNRRAKIVATLGPACPDEQSITKLVQAGMDVARLNFSHGTHEDHAERIRTVRKVSGILHKPISILQDLQGPKLRVGNLPNGAVPLQPGEVILLSSSPELAAAEGATFIPMDVPDLEHSVAPGNRILMDDGNLELVVVNVTPESVEARVVIGGVLKSHKGVNLPGANLTIPGFTEKDQADLAFGIQNGVDIIALSFVRTAEDITKIRDAIRQMSPHKIPPPIIAKLELPEAIKNLHDIIHAADGVMVARGDLGVEMSPAEVPTLQKDIIYSANRHGKLVITATQMLESMIQSPRPTRAEASDVANAIFDGTDAVMLSGETASGKYPIEAIAMMSGIVQEAELNYDQWGHYRDLPEEAAESDSLSIPRAARELAHDRDVKAIAVFTETGRTAILASKSRPRVPVLAFTPSTDTYQRLGLCWGVKPFLIPYASTVEGMLAHVEAAALSGSDLRPGEQMVLISGFPVGAMRKPNFALLHTIGEIS